MARPIKLVTASDAVRAELLRRAKASTSTHRDRFRAKIILFRLDGLKIEDVAERLGTSMPTVRHGRAASSNSAWTASMTREAAAASHRSQPRRSSGSLPRSRAHRRTASAGAVRSMGRHVGISHSTVQRIWSRSEIKPHLTKTFKLSHDPNFEAKFWDVIGLYLDPPANALVLCLR